MPESELSFRELHHQPAPLVVPNPWDVGSARILQTLGFTALATTSAGMAFSLGVRDGAVSVEATLEHCHALVNAVDIPVSADLEQGFGDDPEAIVETVQAAAAAGLAGCSIEDHTGNLDHPLYDGDLAIERIVAAVETKNALDRDFVLTARCENLLWGKPDLGDAITMLQAYAAAGADVVFVPGLTDLDQVKLVCESVDVPVNVVLEMPARPSVTELGVAGAARISIGSVFSRLAYGSMISAAQQIQAGGRFDLPDGLIDYDSLEGMFK